VWIHATFATVAALAVTRLWTDSVTRDLAPLEAARIDESEEKEGVTRPFWLILRLSVR
jgi:hypothetical protein